MDFSDCMVNSWPQFVHLYVPADTSLPVGTGSAIETSCVRSDLPYPAGARQNSRVADVDALEGGEQPAHDLDVLLRHRPRSIPREGARRKMAAGCGPSSDRTAHSRPSIPACNGESPRQPCRRPDSRRRPARGHHGIAENREASFVRLPAALARETRPVRGAVTGPALAGLRLAAFAIPALDLPLACARPRPRTCYLPARVGKEEQAPYSGWS